MSKKYHIGTVYYKISSKTNSGSTVYDYVLKDSLATEPISKEDKTINDFLTDLNSIWKYPMSDISIQAPPFSQFRINDTNLNPVSPLIINQEGLYSFALKENMGFIYTIAPVGNNLSSLIAAVGTNGIETLITYGYYD